MDPRPSPLPRGPRLRSLEARALSVPLREPFVIATARLDVTRSVLVRATLVDGAGRTATGYGEGAALPPVTAEDQPALLASIAAAAPALEGRALGPPADDAAPPAPVDLPVLAAATLAPALDGLLPGPVARAAVEAALLDAWSRLAGLPLWAALRGVGADAAPPPALETDITLPIATPAHMIALAERHHAAGFRCFKVKVGRDARSDRQAVLGVARAIPDALFRLDANGGFTAAEALALLDDVRAAGARVQCFEQPCARDDLAGMARVTAASAGVPVIADESVRDDADLDRLLAARAAHGINLKLVKHGGPLRALALGRRARAEGLGLMVGAMVETRLGLVTMAHVVSALGPTDAAGDVLVDLDTALLLADDPFTGGWRVEGARLTLVSGPGVALAPR